MISSSFLVCTVDVVMVLVTAQLGHCDPTESSFFRKNMRNNPEKSWLASPVKQSADCAYSFVYLNVHDLLVWQCSPTAADAVAKLSECNPSVIDVRKGPFTSEEKRSQFGGEREFTNSLSGPGAKTRGRLGRGRARGDERSGSTRQRDGRGHLRAVLVVVYKICLSPIRVRWRCITHEFYLMITLFRCENTKSTALIRRFASCYSNFLLISHTKADLATPNKHQQ